MNKSKVFFTIVCFMFTFLLGVTTVYPQAEEGNQEILVSGLFWGQMGDYPIFQIMGTFSYGIYVTKNLQIGGGPTIRYFKMGGEDNSDLGIDSSDLSIDIGFFLKHYFRQPGSRAVFFAGGKIDISNAFGSKEKAGSFSDRLKLTPEVGFQYYFFKNVAFVINMGYGFSLKKSEDTIGIGNTLTGSFGVSFVF